MDFVFEVWEFPLISTVSAFGHNFDTNLPPIIVQTLARGTDIVTHCKEGV